MLKGVEFKMQVLQACREIISEWLENAQRAMNAAQEASNSEDKSSAGDKYETSRAMGHRDRDMYARQLLEAKRELEKLNKINLEPSNVVRTGSLIEVNETHYFISTGIGKIEVQGHPIMAISRESPIAALMMGKKINDEFNFNGKLWKIKNLN